MLTLSQLRLEDYFLGTRVNRFSLQIFTIKTQSRRFRTDRLSYLCTECLTSPGTSAPAQQLLIDGFTIQGQRITSSDSSGFQNL